MLLLALTVFSVLLLGAGNPYQAQEGKFLGCLAARVRKRTGSDSIGSCSFFLN